MINKKTIQEEIIKGDTEKAISMLLKLTKKYDHKRYNDAILLSARHHSLEEDKNSEIINNETLTINENKINKALTYQISKLDDSWIIGEPQDQIDENLVEEEEEGYLENSNSKKVLSFIYYYTNESEEIVKKDYEKFYKPIVDRTSEFEKYNLTIKHEFCISSSSLYEKIEEYYREFEEAEFYFHFSGHGNESGIPYDNWLLKDENLAIKLNDERVKFCFFSSCNSENLTKLVKLKKIPISIGTRYEIGNEYAIKFQKKFYNYLLQKKTFLDAFEKSKVDIEETDEKNYRSSQSIEDFIQKNVYVLFIEFANKEYEQHKLLSDFKKPDKEELRKSILLFLDKFKTNELIFLGVTLFGNRFEDTIFNDKKHVIREIHSRVSNPNYKPDEKKWEWFVKEALMFIKNEHGENDYSEDEKKFFDKYGKFKF